MAIRLNVRLANPGHEFFSMATVDVDHAHEHPSSVLGAWVFDIHDGVSSVTLHVVVPAPGGEPVPSLATIDQTLSVVGGVHGLELNNTSGRWSGSHDPRCGDLVVTSTVGGDASAVTLTLDLDFL